MFYLGGVVSAALGIGSFFVAVIGFIAFMILCLNEPIVAVVYGSLFIWFLFRIQAWKRRKAKAFAAAQEVLNEKERQRERERLAYELAVARRPRQLTSLD